MLPPKYGGCNCQYSGLRATILHELELACKGKLKYVTKQKELRKRLRKTIPASRPVLFLPNAMQQELDTAGHCRVGKTYVP